MGRYENRPEVNLPVLRGDFCGLNALSHWRHSAVNFRCSRHHTYDTQSLLYRVTGTSEADLTSGPRTQYLAFQTLFRNCAIGRAE